MAEPDEQQLALEKEILSQAQKFAAERGLHLNPDEKQLAAVIRGLARNRLRWGEQYCPCRIRTRDPEKDRQIICPCEFQEEEISVQGCCHCRLFYKDENEPVTSAESP